MTQLKRPFDSSHEQSFDQSQVLGSGLGGGEGGNSAGGGGAGASASTQKLTAKDAWSYLKEVKEEMFQDQRDKYDLFLDVIKDFKARRIDTAGVIARVKDLFKEHPKLILGFNTFLPKGYEITLNEKDEPPPKRTVEFEEAISFVNKTRKRFQNDDHVYKSFLDILNMYRKEHKGISEVYLEVAVLFVDHPDLLDEFTKFLPDTSATATATQTDKKKSYVKVEEFGGPHEDKDVLITRSFIKDEYLVLTFAVSFQICIAKSSLSVKSTEIISRNELQSLVADLLGKYHDLMEGFNEFLERCERFAQTMMKLHQGTHDQDYKEPDNENNGDLSMQCYTDKKNSAVKIEEFGGPNENKDALKNKYSQEFTFCEKVKERLQSPVDYQAFLKCLHLYSTEVISRKELQSLVRLSINQSIIFSLM
ncbi:paired amphipathic helix protein sin3-like 2 [Nicotiana attenuata]|uniref:Paired amphipathic helix protein sin3-like 2 n=1 Tax=Nicotiana attenuata TaxID=49451 RepID=A0A314LB08_NICAT|nr:paired amphipathic helix protein sin3-like 2 [Nicotiana attenuata]